MTQQYQNYIGGALGRSPRRPPLRAREPGHRRAHRRLPPLRTRGRARRRLRRAGGAGEAGAACPPPSAARSSSAPARSCSESKERFARELTEEMGKVLKEARGDVQEAIDMTYYMAGEGRRTFGQTTPSELPRQVRHVGARAGRRRRLHHAVELPDGDPVVEDHARARHRQHRRLQAVAVLAEERVQPRRRRSRRRACRPASSTSSSAKAPRSAPAIIEHPDVQPDLVHRLERRRQADRRCSARSSASRCRSRWAARTRSPCSTTPTSTSRSTA